MNKTIKRAISMGLAFALTLTGSLSAFPEKASAATEKTVLRIFSTTDLHGQAVKRNFDGNSNHSSGSLAQIQTLIKASKKSMSYGGTMLVDSGDTVYGYLTQKIVDGTIAKEEYMLKAMRVMGYDAITLGNHDFDNGVEYIRDSLDESQMTDKVVLANILDAYTKKPVWASRKIIEKELTTSAGNKVTARIGVVGATIESLSTHANWKDDVIPMSIYDSVKDEVSALKKEAVDAIIVLVHSGLGSNAEKEYTDVSDSLASNLGFEISKIDGVDAVMCGHTHTNIPDVDDDYNNLNYDYKTSLFGGKAIVENQDRGDTVGQTDIEFTVTNGKLAIASKDVELLAVDKNVAEDSEIKELVAPYISELSNHDSKTVFSNDEAVNDYFAYIEDNPLIQASNESKIAYGMKYLRIQGDEYSDFPVIACTSFKDIVGAEDGSDYLSTSKKITAEDIIKVQNYAQENATIYFISGKQLKQWLEWQTASLYQKADLSSAKVSPWTDSYIKKQVKEKGMVPVLNSDWIDNWSTFNVFDGIEYEIDASVSPRRNKNGTDYMKNAVRVTKLTHNGKPVEDSQSFAIVTSVTAASHSGLGTTFKEQTILGQKGKLFDEMVNYMSDLSAAGQTHLSTDDNFRVLFPSENSYIMKSSKASAEYAKDRPWYKRTLGTIDNVTYYEADFSYTYKDEAGPLLVVADTSEGREGDPILVAVQATDASGVKSLKYVKGKADSDVAKWSGATNISGNGFKVTENGIYSVGAIDSKGNSTVKYIEIKNYDKNAIKKPTISTKINNRRTKISGTGIKGATVYIETPGKTYEGVVDGNGKYSVEIDAQKVGTIVSAWQKDGAGRYSDKLDVEVYRNGANTPSIGAVSNINTCLSGVLNDSASYCRVVALMDDCMYVPADKGKEYYENSMLYDPDYEVVECDYEVEDGTFRLYIPSLLANKKITVTSVDWVYRISLSQDFTIREDGPNRAVVKKFYAQEGKLYGRIPAYNGNATDVTVTGASGTYTAQVDASGYFKFDVNDIKEGETLKVKAQDVVNGVARTSGITTVTAASLSEYDGKSSGISFSKVSNVSTTIGVSAPDYPDTQIDLLIESERIPLTLSSSGKAEYELPQVLDAGTRLSVVMRGDTGNIIEAATTTVELAKPVKPVLGNKEDITDKTTLIKIWSSEQYTAVVKYGNIYYKTKKCKYYKKKGLYLYVLKVKNFKAKKKIAVYMENDAGISKRIVIKVKKSKKKTEETQATE